MPAIRRLRPLALPGLALALALACTWAPAAGALDFRVDFRASLYQVGAGDTFSDLLAQHLSESMIQSNVTTGLEDISTTIYAGGVRRDYSVLMETTLTVARPGQYVFQVGTDWGRGGATALIDDATGTILYERVITDDVWWARDWSNPDVFTTTFDFVAGASYRLAWLGFEGCCGGSSTLRFSVDGSPFAPLTSPNIDPMLAPEPSTALLLAGGLAALAARRPARQRTPSRAGLRIGAQNPSSTCV